MRVAAVVVTLDRAAILARALRAISAQTRPVDGVVVVDNGSSDDTLAMLAGEFPEANVIKQGENLGVNGGLSAGIRHAMDLGFDLVWPMDDDSEPEPDALALLLEASLSAPAADLIGFRGGTIRLGWIRHLKGEAALAKRPLLGPGVYEVDFVLVDGALIPRRAVGAVGLPPERYFMMIGDIEYTYRMTRAGFRAGVVGRDRMRNAALGSRGDGSGKLPWRAYYKARNQVRMALEYRSPILLAGCFARQVYLLAGLCRRREWARARALIAGIIDGLLGRMGRTVKPTEARSAP